MPRGATGSLKRTHGVQDQRPDTRFDSDAYWHAFTSYINPDAPDYARTHSDYPLTSAATTSYATPQEATSMLDLPNTNFQFIHDRPAYVDPRYSQHGETQPHTSWHTKLHWAPPRVYQGPTHINHEHIDPACINPSLQHQWNLHETGHYTPHQVVQPQYLGSVDASAMLSGVGSWHSKFYLSCHRGPY